jgi:HK97 gp10 family phage protein
VIKIKEDPANAGVYFVLANLGQLSQRAIRQGFFKLGRDLKTTASKEILRRPKGGRTYLIRGPGGRRRRHIASAPGETHANLSGRLRRSLGWSVKAAEELEFGYMDGVIPGYAPFVEFGTSRMAARPSLKNAIDAVSRNSEVYFGQELDKGFR